MIRKTVGLLCILAIIISVKHVDVRAENLSDEVVDFDVGSGKKWPKQVYAPYVDAGVYDNGNSYFGAPDLVQMQTKTKANYFNLGFIQTTGSITDQKVDWGFAGLASLSEGSDNAQYLGLKKAIKDLRAAGGDITVSFGGANGTAFWQQTQDVSTLANTYREIITGFDLTIIDLDIEGAAMDFAANQANAKAIKQVQDETGVEVILTLPVNPSGLTAEGEAIVQAYVDAGVEVKYVNLMTMNYGSSTINDGEDFGDASIRAIDSTMQQIKSIYAKVNITLTDEQAYAKLGTTPSIGYEGENFPEFTPAMAQKVVDHAQEKEIAQVSYWVVQRDLKIGYGANNQDNYQIGEFSEIFANFNL